MVFVHRPTTPHSGGWDRNLCVCEYVCVCVWVGVRVWVGVHVWVGVRVWEGDE